MSSNTNLFYKLYSTSNNVVNSGFKCSTTVDEEDTSFDITASSSGSAGVITDSNGNTLASIDMSDIHAAGITQYNSETRILQPYSCCLLQGQEYGLACASYYFLIPKALKELEGYETYVSCDFDIIYNNFTPYKFHVETTIDGETSFIDLINEQLSENDIQVQVSLQDLEDPCDKATYEYLVFLSLKEGYFYYINNIKLTPGFQSEEYPDSPFSKSLSGLKSIIYDLIEDYKPRKTEEDCGCDSSCECTCCHDDDDYEVDCELYRWIIINYQELVDNLANFKLALVYFRLYEEYGDESDLEKGNELIKDTPYNDDFLNDYDLDNMEIISNIVETLKEYIKQSNDYYQNMYWLIEDRRRRIPLMKYPNGAFRGIVVIPDWPTNDSDEDNAYKSLWVNHIKSQIKLYRPTKQHQFLPKVYGVISNATIMAEEDTYKKCCPEFKGLQTNCACCNHIQDGWNDNLSTDYIDPYRPEHSIYDDAAYMGLNYYAHKKNVIGLYRYMQYINDEKLWNKVGQAYMIIGNEDDPQSIDKNLPQSLIIYNPNPEPIRIKYIIFS